MEGWRNVGIPGTSSSQPRRHVHPTTRPRQRLQPPDVIIFDNVGDLDEIDPSVCQVRPLCQCQASGSRGRGDLYVHSGRHRHGDRDISRGDEDNFQDVSDVTSDTSSSPASPDFSDVSDLDLDLDLDLPLRSAWSNRDGWSSLAPSSLRPDLERGDSRSALVRVSAREVLAEVRGQRSRGSREGADTATPATPARQDDEDIASSSDGGAPRIVENSRPTAQDSQQAPSTGHNQARQNLDAKCSVFNCISEATTSAYVRCKNCSRVFCQQCVAHSNSARRCYKRPRGHSFILISHPALPNSSSNNNNDNGDFSIASVLGTSTSQGNHNHHRHHRRRQGYHHHHSNHNNHSHHHHPHQGSRHQQHGSSRRHHHHNQQHSFHHHGNVDSSHQHQRQRSRDCHRSRSRGRHRSLGGQGWEPESRTHVHNMDGRHSQTSAVDSIFQDLII